MYACIDIPCLENSSEFSCTLPLPLLDCIYFADKGAQKKIHVVCSCL